MGSTYKISICQSILYKDNDPVNVLLLFDEAVSLAVGEITNDVEGEVVEPCEEIDGMRLVCVIMLNLLHEGLDGVLHEVLIRCSCTRGEGSIDTLAKIVVPFLVNAGEEGVNLVAMLHCRIDRIVARLGGLSDGSLSMLEELYLGEIPTRIIDIFDRFRLSKGEAIGSKSNDIAVLLVQLQGRDLA